MRHTLLFLALCTLSASALPRDWSWHDNRGNKAMVKIAAWPQNAKLRAAFRTAFIPDPKPLLVPDSSFNYEAGVRTTLDNARVYSAVERGLTTYHDPRGQMVGAHPTKVLNVLNWDRRTNSKLKLGALLDKKQMTAVLPLIKRHADYPEAFDSADSLGFYLTSKDVVFCLPDAPFVSASAESRVPYAELTPFAAPHSPLLDMR